MSLQEIEYPIERKEKGAITKDDLVGMNCINFLFIIGICIMGYYAIDLRKMELETEKWTKGDAIIYQTYIKYENLHRGKKNFTPVILYRYIVDDIDYYSSNFYYASNYSSSSSESSASRFLNEYSVNSTIIIS